MSTTRKQPSTIGRRRLASELRILRGEIPREKVSEDTGISTGTIFKMEKARTRPQRRTLIHLLTYYGVEEDKQADLLSLLRHSSDLQWLREFGDNLPGHYQHFISFERDAIRLSTYEAALVPGLLQTAAYTEALIRASQPQTSDDEVERRLEIRTHRREVLSRERPVRLRVILDEAVIRRRVGTPHVHREQLDHLLAATQIANVRIQVIPFTAGAHMGMSGKFTIMEFPEPDAPMVYTENASGGLFLESAAELRFYRDNYLRLMALASSVNTTQRMIREAAEAA
ncbi:Scr1 family TA system antitoxin-like transcriptional regulator [Actinoplanes sp. NPDC049265]|uniref:Scr1 family TA system antitoxin-like transcriptional regulator n=1 Tax=Actinoplanes sp. NPDC049265 TaxID=3363902 RepID=UPI003713925D